MNSATLRTFRDGVLLPGAALRCAAGPRVAGRSDARVQSSSTYCLRKHIDAATRRPCWSPQGLPPRWRHRAGPRVRTSRPPTPLTRLREAVAAPDGARDRTPPEAGAHETVRESASPRTGSSLAERRPRSTGLGRLQALMAAPPAFGGGVSPPTPTRPAAPESDPRSAGGSTAGPSRRACRRCPWPPPSAAVRPGSGRPGAPGR